MEQNSIKHCVCLWKTGFYLHIAIIYTRYIVFGRINELCEVNHWIAFSICLFKHSKEFSTLNVRTFIYENSLDLFDKLIAITRSMSSMIQSYHKIFTPTNKHGPKYCNENIYTQQGSCGRLYFSKAINVRATNNF